MIITRKIRVFIKEEDKDLRDSFYKKMYDMRYAARRTANITASHSYMLDISTPYLSEEDRDNLTFLGARGDECSRLNAPYTAVSSEFKGKADMDSLSCVIQDVRKNYAEDVKKKGLLKGDISLRNYKTDIPIPFKARRFNIRQADYIDGNGKKRNGVFFTLMGIPFQMVFGRDRSGNRCIVDRVMAGDYKMCTSSIVVTKEYDKKIGKDVQKMYLNLCVDIPEKETVLKPDKKLYAFLGVFEPIVCTTEVTESLDALGGAYKVWKIGTEEEFNHRRRQIQEAVKRCQINNKYSVGGKGRKKKNKALERFQDKEKNYVDTKLHTYSRMLVDMAIKHECSEIVLMKQEEREVKAKDDNKEGKPFVLRNWGYYGLKEKIQYKSKMYGIKLTVE